MIEERELSTIKGGAVNWGVIGIGGTIISFLIGLVDGQIKLK